MIDRVPEDPVPAGPGPQPAGEGEYSGPSVVPSAPAAKLKIILIALGAVAGLGLVAAAALVLALKPTSAVQKMVPDNADVYALVYLNPPLGQKVNLLKLAHKFPDLSTDQEIRKRVNDALSAALKDEGITYETDLEPWLGNEMAFLAQFGGSVPAAIPLDPAAILIDSKDDAKAKALLAKLRKGTEGSKLSWGDEAYQGVTISVGTPPAGNVSDSFVYAYTDRTMILSNSVSYVRDVIDAGKGRKGRAVDTPNFKATMSRLPSERLGFLYVNGKSVADRIKKDAGRISSGLKFLRGNLGQLDAFTGLGFTVSAKPNGLMSDMEIKLDASKLDPATRSALSAPPHSNSVTAWVPSQAYGLFTTTGLKQAVQSAVDSASPEARQQLEAMGLTPSLSHLTGDAGVVIQPAGAAVDSAGILDGALIVGTDDPAGASAFLDSYFSHLTQNPGSGTGVRLTKSKYKGVTLTTLTMPQLAWLGAVNPTFAVTGGMVLIGSSMGEIRAIMDAHETGQSIAQVNQFVSMTKEVDPNPSTLIYVDIAEVIRQIAQRIPVGARTDIQPALRNASPVIAFILSAKGSPDQVSQKTFLRID